jgi:hypothetical protein
MKAYIVLVAAIVILATAGIAWASQTITATTDVNGHARPATAEINGPSNVRCTSAAGQAGQKPSCSVAAPGYAGIVEIGKVIATDGGGTVTLTCNGNPPLRCTAEITP